MDGSIAIRDGLVDAMDFADTDTSKQLVQFTVALVGDPLLREDIAMNGSSCSLAGLVMHGVRILLHVAVQCHRVFLLPSTGQVDLGRVKLHSFWVFLPVDVQVDHYYVRLTNFLRS